ncbi:MAG TPA: hypothetical protein VIJ19_01720 [Opitutaceae bacterium]
MKEPLQVYRPNIGKLIIAYVGTVAFFGGGIVIAFHTRQLQAAGLSMMDGNGQAISATKAYLGAAAMFLAASIYAWRAQVLRRQRREAAD